MTIKLSEIQEFMGNAATTADAEAMIEVMKVHGFELSAVDAEVIREIPEPEWLSMCDEAVSIAASL